VQSVSITTNVVSSNLAHDEVYSIQHRVITFVGYLRRWWDSPGTPVSSTNKTDSHDISEILLKLALRMKTITLLWCVAIYATCIPYNLTKTIYSS
jgi:hypothetical protein